MKRFFKDGDVVLFQGDSITDTHRDKETNIGLGEGYPPKVKAIYDALFPGNDVKFINRAVSGDRTINLVERYDRDIKAVNPDFVSILVGVNDTWRKFDRNDETTVEQFEKNYRFILDGIKRDFPKAKIMMIEPYLLTTKPERAEWFSTLDPMIRVIRKLGMEYADYYLSLEGAFHKYLSKGLTEADISEDGVHPTQTGHGIIAYEYLKALEII